MTSPRSTDAGLRLPTRLRSGLARNTAWAMGAESVKLVTAVGTFLIVTYLLPPGDYGIYVGTLGLMWFVLPFATFGAGYLLLKRVAGEQVDLTEAVGRANGMVIIGGGVAVVLLTAVRPVVLPQSPGLVLALLAVAELIFGGLQEVAVFATQASERLRLSMVLRLLQGASRLLAAAVLVVVDPSAGLVAWAWLHLLTAAVTAIASQALTSPAARLVPLRRPSVTEVRLGFPYSIGFGADKLRESADAMLLLRIGTSVDAGIFGAATRLINLAVVPVRALIASSNAKLFAVGARSVTGTSALARRITVLGATYATLAAVVIAAGGPTVVSVLSDEYASAGEAIRLLALLPLAVSLEAFAATSLTAIGHQGIRVASTFASTGLNVALNILLIPSHGWRGAVVASLACSAMNATILWTALMVLRGRERRSSPEPASGASTSEMAE